MNYNIEDLKLYKERQDYEKHFHLNTPYIYDMEKNLSKEEKIEFIDAYYDCRGKKGMATYMLNLMNKFNAEKKTLKLDERGDVKTVSLKAWLKKNDTLKIVNDYYRYGHYYFCGREYLNFSSDTPSSAWDSDMPYRNEKGKIVDQWFHDLLNGLYNEEIKYYKTHNPMYQKVKQIVDYCRMYGGLGIELFSLVGGNGYQVLDDKWLKTFGHTKPTEEELDKMLEAYKEVDAIMQAKTKEIQERLGWKLQE